MQRRLLRRLLQHARVRRVPLPQVLATPYVNTIGLDEQPPYQGNLELEARLSAALSGKDVSGAWPTRGCCSARNDFWFANYF